MKIIHPVARTVEFPHLPEMGRVEFDTPSRLWLGHVDWHTDFRFTVGDREYWGHVWSTGAVELRTHSGDRTTALSQYNHRAWREALAAEGRDLIAEARRIWMMANAETIEGCDYIVDAHYKALREAVAAKSDWMKFIDKEPTLQVLPDAIIDEQVVETKVANDGPIAIVTERGVDQAGLERIAQGQRQLYKASVESMAQSTPAKPTYDELVELLRGAATAAVACAWPDKDPRVNRALNTIRTHFTKED